MPIVRLLHELDLPTVATRKRVMSVPAWEEARVYLNAQVKFQEKE